MSNTHQVKYKVKCEVKCETFLWFWLFFLFSFFFSPFPVEGLKGELAVEENEEEAQNSAREARRKERKDVAAAERQLKRDEARSAMEEEGMIQYDMRGTVELIVSCLFRA